MSQATKTESTEVTKQAEENEYQLQDISSDHENSSSSAKHGDDVSLAGGLPKSTGVKRIEGVKLMMDETQKGRTYKIILSVCILICAWAAALDSSTTYNYDTYATSSFGHHSMLSTLSIATSIISAIAKPILAKISDITTRPTTYIIVLFFYVIGTIIVSSSSSISAYIVGQSFVAVGSSGIDLMNNILTADLTPLQWRGVAQGALSTPYIINTWFSGLIVEDLIPYKWRWGYGMFAIIMPVVMAPAIGVMIYLDRLAHKQGLLSYGDSKYNRETAEADREKWMTLLKRGLIEADAFGLLILGFGWALLLLPFSLASTASDGWKNPSLIAMMVVGGILLIVYAIYEIKFSPFPSAPKRVVLNKTFAMAVLIDFSYEVGGYIRILYLTSIVWVIKNWSAQNWTYYGNTLTMSLCFFGVVVGGLQRWTHHYKLIQIVGICIAIIGQGITIRNKTIDSSTAALVIVQVFCGIGGACSVVGTQVSSQGSVPHQDVSLVISLLSLWSNIGAAIGAAVAAPIWSAKLLHYLRLYMPDSVTEAEIQEIYGSINVARAYEWGSELRESAIKAYCATAYYMFAIALGIYFINLICTCFQTNYYLGEEQNAVERKLAGEESDAEAQEPATFKEKVRKQFLW